MHMFVITVETADELKFYAIDDSSGGRPYWSPWITSARVFKSYDEAKKAITNKQDFVDPWFNGAPIMIHSGIGLSYKKTKGIGKFAIKKIVFETIEEEIVEAEIASS